MGSECDSIEVTYNRQLDPLTKVLGSVVRKGDFYAYGSLEAVLPRLVVDPVGPVAFPVLPVQAKELIRSAEQAPYGQGAATLVDRNVRRVWQYPTPVVQLSGKSWPATLNSIVERAANGLGVPSANVKADLYKLLIYEKGDFFVSHRDTEKADGMFATLVISLPSAHRGGQLVVRHSDREAVLNLASAENSKLTFAAFYADCEHEVRPLEDGHRVCLVYNLIANQKAKRDLAPPLYQRETQQVAAALQEVFASDSAPTKVVYALEHQYSPAGLAFASLKGADAARASVLSNAAQQADCRVHLGIVHIEEFGPAEQLEYRGGYGDEDCETDEDAAFEVIEVSDSNHYIAQWKDARDLPVDFGNIPLGTAELVPAGCFDDEKPDEQRLTEATGNEGASFERSYHRAALILWPNDRGFDVLLQSGLQAPIAHLERLLLEPRRSPDAVASCIRKLISHWEAAAARAHTSAQRSEFRTRTLALLGRTNVPDATERFVRDVVLSSYDGSENRALVGIEGVIGKASMTALASLLLRQHGRARFAECAELVEELAAVEAAELETLFAALFEGLSSDGRKEPDDPWNFELKRRLIDGKALAQLLVRLQQSKSRALIDRCATVLGNSGSLVPPDAVLIPALRILSQKLDLKAATHRSFVRLWAHATTFVLARSEFAPEPPTDWVQPAQLSCVCELCRELEAFARSPTEREHRFRVRKELRQHLHRAIDGSGLDMTHVTLRDSSPQTLVCTKTRDTYERQCRQYQADLESLDALAGISFGVGQADPKLVNRLQTSRNRSLSSKSKVGPNVPKRRARNGEAREGS